MPIGGWPMDERLKKVGLYNWLACDEGLLGVFEWILLRKLSWRKADREVSPLKDDGADILLLIQRAGVSSLELKVLVAMALLWRSRILGLGADGWLSLSSVLLPMGDGCHATVRHWLHKI